MSRRWSIHAALLSAWLCGSSAASQEPSRFGLNLSVAGTAQVGFTFHATPGVALRPAVSLVWRRLRPGNGPEVTFTDFGFGADALFSLVGGGAVVPYLGAGGSYVVSRASGTTLAGDGHTVFAQGLFGLRARIVERIHIYGEASLGFFDSRTPATQATNQLILRTTPLGVLIYLK